MKHVLVLGATGMLGAYSTLALGKNGFRVTAASRRVSDNGFFGNHGIPYVGGWELSKPSSYDRLPTDIDAVVHMAGFMPAHGDASVLPYVKSIVEGSANVCEWMLSRTRCRRIVFNTTPADVAAHRGGAKPIADDAPRSFPRDGSDHAAYAVCKIAATDLMEIYRQTRGLLPIVFRHMTVFGWHPNATFNVNGKATVSPWRQVLRRCIAGLPIEIWGNPERRSELLYVDDFTDAVCMAVRSNCCGLFNLPGIRPYTLEEEFAALRKVFGPVDTRYGSIPGGGGGGNVVVLYIARNCPLLPNAFSMAKRRIGNSVGSREFRGKKHAFAFARKWKKTVLLRFGAKPHRRTVCLQTGSGLNAA